MTILIGKSADELCGFLRDNGLDAATYQPSQIPSLTALLVQQPEISNIVLLPSEETNWSLGHILAAAKQLYGKGRMIFMGSSAKQPALITVVDNREMLLRILRKPLKPPADTAGGHTLQKPIVSTPAIKESKPIRPMDIPPDRILILGVAGTQHRIGSTTQTIALWHYCKALGFDPAIVSSPAQIAVIAGSMKRQEITGGYLVEGIPFVADTNLAYDCYIRDIGPEQIQEALHKTDHLILVAGSKPWELQHTAAALRAARGADLTILLSFSSENDAKTLQPLFGRMTATVMPWMPDLWHPSGDVIEIYDSVLREILERLLTRGEPQPEEDSPE